MKAFVVINSEYDYDSPNSERLLSCAIFSTHAYAKEYVDARGEEVYDDDGILASKSIIIEAEMDEFAKSSKNKKLNALLDTLPSYKMTHPQKSYLSLQKNGCICVDYSNCRNGIKVERENVTIHEKHYDAYLRVVNNKIIDANISFDKNNIAQLYIDTASLKCKTLDEAVKNAISELVAERQRAIDNVSKQVQYMKDIACKLDQK